jgi:hypothetical protein
MQDAGPALLALPSAEQEQVRVRGGGVGWGGLSAALGLWPCWGQELVLCCKHGAMCVCVGGGGGLLSRTLCAV